VGSGQGGLRCHDRLVRLPRSTTTIGEVDESLRADRATNPGQQWQRNCGEPIADAPSPVA
jgi:hypothetical protein